MDDVPGIPVPVEDVAWHGQRRWIDHRHRDAGGAAGSSARRRLQVGVAFFDVAGAFVGAVVTPADGRPLTANERRPFSITGGGVDVATVASAVPTP